MENPVIDPQEILIQSDDFPNFDSKLTVTMPSHCIQKIAGRLIEGGMEQSDEQLLQLLLKICVDEAIARQR